MRRSYPYLNDSAFLKQVDECRDRSQTARITVLDQNEKALKEITDTVIKGTFNVSGVSTMRRTGTLTILADPVQNDLEDVTSTLSINKKVYVEVGVENTIDTTKYDSMLWFPLGVYVITRASISHQINQFELSITLNDKMCLLDGSVSGVLPASVTFHERETQNALGEVVTDRPTIYQIIQELVHHFGGEDQSRIYIQDLDTRVRRVMKYMGDDDIYLVETHTAKKGDQFSIVKTGAVDSDGNPVDSKSAVQKISTGEDVGYIYEDFYYPEDLIGNPGSTITSILDEIIKKLGNYEYYYDVYGNFIFHEKKNYLNTSQSTDIINNLSNDSYQVDYYKGKAVYIFGKDLTATVFTNTPNYSNIKNDFIIWGKKPLASGGTSSIRLHLSIDDKPEIGNTYEAIFYKDDNENIRAKCAITHVSSMDDLPNPGIADMYYVLKNKIYTWNSTDCKYETVDEAYIDKITTKDWREELYYSGLNSTTLATDKNAYYTELVEELPKIYNLDTGTWKDSTIKTPSGLDYFLDIINGAEVSKFSISSIGRRSYIADNDSINCLFLPNIPNYILIDGGLSTDEQNTAIQEAQSHGYKYIIVEAEIYDEFFNGGNSYSAYEYLQSILYKKVSFNDEITIQTLPIYYLEPNTRITVQDDTTGISGDYIINTISYSLECGQTSTLVCSRALQRI